jgi:hypothetical protein
VTPPEPDVPPAGEEIHLPSPSVLPALTAVGITLLIVGITTYWELSVIGGLLTLYCVVRWARESRAELDELPLDAQER